MKNAARNQRAFILLEVMLAAAIFALAGIALVTALNNIAKTHIEATRLSAIRQELASRLAEARLDRLEIGKNTEKANAAGVVFSREVSALEMQRQNPELPGSSIPIQGLYKLSITASWTQGKIPQSESAEIYVYQP